MLNMNECLEKLQSVRNPRLYIMRGCPASGKTTLIYGCGLSDYAVSTDDIRLEQNGTEILNGIEMISQKNPKLIFSIVYDNIRFRMEHRIPIILDATNINQLGAYYKLASAYEYEVVVVDFKVSLDVLKERNKNRGIRYVPEEVIERMYEKKKVSQILQQGVRIIRPSDFYNDWKKGLQNK